MRLAMGQPWLKSFVLPVWLLSEVEVAADVEVGRVVQLLEAELAAELHRVAAADEGHHVAQVDRVVAHPVVEEGRAAGLVGARVGRVHGVAVAGEPDERQAAVLRRGRAQAEVADLAMPDVKFLFETSEREKPALKWLMKCRRQRPVVLQRARSRT